MIQIDYNAISCNWKGSHNFSKCDLVLMYLCIQEKAKAQEDYRKNRLEYRQFLETCGFIKVSLLTPDVFGFGWGWEWDG